ncbi:hypothetical protein KUV65_12230 [Maritalea mobilis]|uniref:hypothetical protein n=1 Tax=Maritalea mobilis TaxID=483324 RepID=UPI001C97EA09|nr:hypothetical protein [Maritalea mobilis]MBY6202136.1 hypothetical protein [Maritalea mobilis]
MLNLGRLSIILLVGLSVVYLSLYFYLRAGAKMQLEEDWVMEGRPGDRDDWVAERLEPRAASLRKWLVFLVYVLPICALSVTVYLTN